MAAAALGTFLLTERGVAHPMVPSSLFRSRNVTVSVAVGFALVVGYYGLPFVMSLYLQQLRGLSSFGTGLRTSLLVAAVVVAVAAVISSRLQSPSGLPVPVDAVAMIPDALR